MEKILVTDPKDLDKMRAACQAAAQTLDYLEQFIKPGVTTAEIDRLCLEYITDELNVQSATVGYAPAGYPPFPGAVCTSVNHVICHGIPSDKKLKKGDIINLDVTIIKDGWYGDTSRMFYIGEPSIQARRLTETTYECMWLGSQQVKPGNTLGDIGYAIQEHAHERGLSVVREFSGHGIGRQFRQDPQLLPYGRPGPARRQEAGMSFTIEPMINAERRDIRQLNAGWTIVTRDRSLSAQWEHTVRVTDTGYEVLTIS